MRRYTFAFILLLMVTLARGGDAAVAAGSASGRQTGPTPARNSYAIIPIDLSNWLYALLSNGLPQEPVACTPSPPVTRIMPLGDSITHGTFGSDYPDTRPDTQVGGYRLPLYAGLRNAGYSVDFAGSVNTGDNYSNFDFEHEGHRGWRDHEIADEIYGWLGDTPAEIILLHIGTNGLNSNPADVEEILDEINRYEQDAGADIVTIVARIINRVNHSNTTTQFNDNVEAMVNARGDGDIFMVDMEDGAGIVYSFSTSGGDMADNLHPYATGYQKMANKWLGEMNSLGLTSCLLPPFIHILPEASASAGQLFTYPVLASGNPAPTFSLTQKPAGMTIDPTTGIISWTPGSAGTTNVTVRATNSEGFDEESFTITVSDTPAAPVIESIPDQDAVTGAPFTYDVQAGGNPAPTFSLVDTPPEGMTIDASTGVISWTPDATGAFNVTVHAANSEGFDEESFTIIVTAAGVAPVLSPIANQNATVGTLFTYAATASGNPSPTYSLSQKPAGMTIHPTTGVISWTPGTTGTFDVTVKATNSYGTDEQSFAVTVTQEFLLFLPVAKR